MKILGKVVDKNDNSFLKDLIQRTNHYEWEVRMAALKALVYVVDKGNKHAIAAAIARLSDEDEDVRSAARDVCEQLGVSNYEATDKVMDGVLQFVTTSDEVSADAPENAVD